MGCTGSKEASREPVTQATPAKLGKAANDARVDVRYIAEQLDIIATPVPPANSVASTPQLHCAARTSMESRRRRRRLPLA